MALDQQTAELLGRLNAPAEGASEAAAEVSIAAARIGARAVWLMFAGDDEAACRAEDIEVPGAAGPIPARLYRPLAPERKHLPLVLFLHGGGWSLGDLDSYDGLMRALCAGSGVAFLSLDYRLAPEHKFPAGLDDGLAAVRWLAQEAASLGADAGRLAVMGDSAGGNLAAVIAQSLADGSGPRLAAQFLLYPMLDVSVPHDAYPSRMAFGNGEYLLTRDAIDGAVAWYLDDPARVSDPRISPLLAQDLSGLPFTLLLTAGFDPLLDEARAYHARLRAAGVPTEFKCFETTIHAFLSFGVLDVAREARRFLARQVRARLLD